MNKSDSIVEIAKALSAFQAELSSFLQKLIFTRCLLTAAKSVVSTVIANLVNKVKQFSHCNLHKNIEPFEKRPSLSFFLLFSFVAAM